MTNKNVWVICVNYEGLFEDKYWNTKEDAMEWLRHEGDLKEDGSLPEYLYLQELKGSPRIHLWSP